MLACSRLILFCFVIALLPINFAFVEEVQNRELASNMKLINYGRGGHNKWLNLEKKREADHLHLLALE